MEAATQDHAPATWTGPWPGVVVDDKDPDTGGRLRIRVPSVYGAQDEGEKIEDDQLPWARPGALCTGNKSGIIAVPEIGAEVWVMFRDGDGERPVWFGGWFSQAKIPDEFKSSYAQGPKTWLMRTPNGHVIEMRFKPGEEKILAVTEGGYEFLLDDVEKKARVTTPGNREMVLDDTVQQARMKDATQSVVIDTAAQAINVTTPGQANVTAGGAATVVAQGVTLQSTGVAPSVSTGGGVSIKNFLGAATWTFALAFSMLVGTAFTLTVGGVLTLTGASLIIATAGGAGSLALGSIAAAKQRLATEAFLTKYNGHTHLYSPGPGVPTPTAGPLPVADLSPSSTDVTQEVVAS